MSDNLKVANNRVVQFNYTLKTDTGELLDTSDGVDPLTYLHGASMVVPGLERHMAGHQVGDKFSAVVSPEEGYGEYQEPGPQPVPRTSFPAEAELLVGMSFPVEAKSGERFSVWITDVQDDTVYVDANHPLAGKTLHFDIEIMTIRDATQEEVAHGHPHGPGGHHH
jgi:FKBP-type peptidyl-prolyl cis-trans isomerase SlyD